MVHQLDRIEEMLQRLTASAPDSNMIDRRLVARSLTDLFQNIIWRKKIEAIKEYRSLTGIGLKESKDAIEKLYTELAAER